MTFRVHRHKIERTVGGSFSFFYASRLFFPSKLQLEIFIRLISFSFHIVRLCLPFLFYLFPVSSRYTFIRLYSFVVSFIRTLSHIAPPPPIFYIVFIYFSQTFSHPFVAAFYFTLLPPRAFQFPPSFHSISSFVTLMFTWLLPSSSFPLLETHSRVGLPVYFLPGTALVFRFAPRSRTDIVLSSRRRHPTRSAEIAHLYVYSYTFIRRVTINYYCTSTIKL